MKGVNVMDDFISDFLGGVETEDDTIVVQKKR